MAFLSKYRVYYEDTDAGGVVYYANYLKFLERGRTDFLLSKNIKQTELALKNILFVVSKVSIKYIAPLKFEDEVIVETKINKTTKTRIFFYQKIYVDTFLKASSEVLVVCVRADNFKPQFFNLNI